MRYLTKEQLSMKEYHASGGVGASGLKAFGKSPATFIWSQSAPEMLGSSKASDFGTALHTAILEPDNFDSQVLISPTAGRNTKATIDLATANPDNIVLVESEVEQIKVMIESAKAHPTFAKYLGQKFDPEASIFIECPETKLMRKVRIDMNFAQYGADYIGDLKSAKSISDFHSTQRWKNPLFCYEYGLSAAYYLHTASLYYGRTISSYLFFVIQTTIEMGKYPVDVIEITWEELEHLGFFEQFQTNFKALAECKDFAVTSKFPDFGSDSEEIEIITSEDDNE